MKCLQSSQFNKLFYGHGVTLWGRLATVEAIVFTGSILNFHMFLINFDNFNIMCYIVLYDVHTFY